MPYREGFLPGSRFNIEMKLALVLLIILASFNPKPSSFIKGKGFEGYIFGESHPVLVTIENQQARYSPGVEDIYLAERLLKDELATVNNPMYDQGGNCPVIHKRLHKYIRQYVGFVNEAGEKVIWINFIWKSGADGKRLADDIEIILDGCSYYWNIKVNLDRGILYALYVNGLA